MQQYIIKKNKAFLRITSSSMDTTFRIPRELISLLAVHDWRLRANGTAICRGTNLALHRCIFWQYNGFQPRQVKYLDGNSTNLLPDNLRGII